MHVNQKYTKGMLQMWLQIIRLPFAWLDHIQPDIGYSASMLAQTANKYLSVQNIEKISKMFSVGNKIEKQVLR